jgi:hypothetical protein
MSKSMERAMEAAHAVDAVGGKVTSEAIDAWLRARDGVGCSMREASRAGRSFRSESRRRIEYKVDDIIKQLERDTELREWERIEVMRQLAKRRKRIGRVGE